MGRVRVHQHVNPLAPHYRQAPKPIDLHTIYADPSRPLLLDIGSARGRFLLRMATAQPDWNYLGVEIREPLVEEANRLAAETGLTNVHYSFCNAMLWLDRLIENIPEGILQMVTIQFPDPWFKKKHAKRRMVNAELVKVVVDKLDDEGRIFIQTDIGPLSVEIFELFRADRRLMELLDSKNPFPVKTEREKAVEDKHLPVYRAVFMMDPDYEINRPLDKRFVAVGLVMMIASLPLAALAENEYLKWFFAACFFASFIVMARRERRSTSNSSPS
jgi:tRNA (guanine-N7-)-methyltransferase